MMNFALIVFALLLMVSLTEQQDQQTGVETSELCKEDLSAIINTAFVHKHDLMDKRKEVIAAIAEKEELETKVQNLTTQIQEIVDTCSGFLPLDCCQINVLNSSAETGVYVIKDPCAGNRAFADNYAKMHVRCDMETDGGGWIVIQRRTNRTVNFYRNWEDYENGFGDLHGEFWIGLSTIYQLTNQQEVELQVSVWNDTESAITWTYQTFRISGPENKYRLTIGNGTGNDRRSDALKSHNGLYFSTYDRDNDMANGNCAIQYQGGWWYKYCYTASLNGQQLRWVWWGDVYTHTLMMIRSKTCGVGSTEGFF